MLNSVYSTDGFYYSTTYDLTYSQQRLFGTGPSFKSESLFHRADERFTWNRFLLLTWERQLVAGLNHLNSVSCNVSDFCIPIIQGYVGIISNYSCFYGDYLSDNFKKSTPIYSLISRRLVYRTGTRFNARGVDSLGHSANTVETEQILEISDHRFSFVQLRGSVPIYWSQKPNLRYKPNVLLGGSHRLNSASSKSSLLSSTTNNTCQMDDECMELLQNQILQKHFHQLIYDFGYGSQVIVNLLNQKGMEQPLGHSYAVAISTLNDNKIKYESFDFHRECGSTRWDRLGILLQRLIPELVRFKQFHLFVDSPNETPISQLGTFRTNCIDCLDRTNVLQSMLGWCALEQALIDAHVLNAKAVSTNADASTNSPLANELWPSFGPQFKAIWADNADQCSIQYTGTRALKTDFTRTGKRTIWGMLMDGYHSAVRYYLNNFSDGFRQDAMHLLLGQYETHDADGQPKPLTSPGGPRADGSNRLRFFQILPLTFSFTLAMSVLCFIFPTAHWTERIMYFLFWGAASVLSVFTIFMYGEEFVDRPRFFPD